MTIQSDMALLAAGSYWDIRKEDDEFNNDAPLPEGWVVVPTEQRGQVLPFAPNQVICRDGQTTAH